MKTKNYEIYFDAYIHLWKWSLLFDLEIESISKDYTEVDLSVLCFSFSFSRFSESFITELDKMMEDISNG